MVASFRSLVRLFVLRVGVDRARERRAEARQVRAALVRVDVVGERELLRVVAVVPLQRDLGVDALALAAHVDRLLVDEALVLVQVLDERDDAAVVVEPVRSCRRARRSSVMVTPALRNASSRRRCASVSKLNSVVSKICGRA